MDAAARGYDNAADPAATVPARMDLGPVFFTIGLLIAFTALAMAIPTAVDLAAGNPDWQVFAGSAMLTLFVGVSTMLTTRGTATTALTLRQAFLLTALAWVAIAVFAALPFAFSGLDMSATDAFFESMSGITTTGSTVIVGLDLAPPGILIWRALLQWLGGIGIIVIAVAVLPLLSVGGMQLFRIEAFDTPEKVLPRAAQMAGEIGVIYLALTMLCALALWLAGLSGFDAVAHAMTTIATGGYSTVDASVGHFQNATVDWIITVGMLLGSLPFVLYLHAVRGRPTVFWRDSQVRWFIGIAGLSTVAVTGWLWVHLEHEPLTALRLAAFNAVSVMTGTGYATANFDAWGGFATTILFCLMFVGGCAGSTTCGIKVFRLQVLYATAQVQMRRLLQPHGVFIAYYNRRPIPEEVAESVMGFFFMYAVCFAVLALLLGATGLDLVTSLAGAATTISNVGPGLGPVIGPTGTFQPLSDLAKWAMCFGMLLGRLELFTVLILFTPAFWRR